MKMSILIYLFLALSTSGSPSLRGDVGTLRVSGATSPQGSFNAIGAGQYFQAQDLLNYGPERTTSSGTEGSFAVSYSVLNALEIFFSASDIEHTVSPGGDAFARGDFLIGSKFGLSLPLSSRINAWIGADVFSKFFTALHGEGIEPDATSIGGRIIWSMDFTGIGAPLRAHVNIGYLRDNTSIFADKVTSPLYRYALKVAGEDQLIGGIAAELPLLSARLIPFLEYTTEQVSEKSYAMNPQRITPGIRYLPVKGIALTLGCDLSLRGREVSPEERIIYLEPPWNIILALSFSHIPEKKAPQREVEAPPSTTVEKAVVPTMEAPPPAPVEKKKAIVILEKGKIEVPGETIFFEYDSPALRQEALPILDSIAEILRANTTLRVRIEGHTDNIGREEYNRLLSQMRANTVKNYLVTRGISPDRLETTGYGSSRPIADNSTLEGRAKNRRVEFIIIK